MVKLVTTNKDGMPDLLLLRDGMATFVEVKAIDGRRTPLQRFRAKELQGAGCLVMTVTLGGILVDDAENPVYEEFGF